MATTARPARTRGAAATKSTPAKAAPAKAAPAKATEPEVPAEAATSGEGTKHVAELRHVGDTSRYSKWQPDGEGTVGNVYLPLGTTRAGIVYFS